MAVRKLKESVPDLPLIKERVGEIEIEYYPLGRYIAIQPQVCGGRPTVKNTRITAEGILGALKRGDSPEKVAEDFRIPLDAIAEAVALAEHYDYRKSYA